jgi:PAS domain S-box-containing protein
MESIVEIRENLDSSIVDSVRMVLIAVDRNLNVTRWNRFSEKIYGISQANAVGKNILEVLPVFAREHLEQYITSVLNTGKDYTASDFEHISKKSYNIYITLKIVPIKTAGGEVTGAVVFVDNITARKLAEEALRQKNKELGILNSITSDINRTKNMNELLGFVLNESLELLSMDIGAIYLFKGEGSKELRLQKVTMRTPAGHFITCKEAIGVNASVDLNRIYCSRGKEIAPFDSMFENHQHLVCLPLSAKDKLLGVMAIGSLREADACEEKASLLLGIGSQLGFAIENFYLFDRIAETNSYLKDIINESPDAMLTVDQNGKILTFNRSASRLLKFEAEEIVGRHVSTILPVGAGSDILESKNYVREFRTKTDSLITLNISASKIYKENLNSDYIITLKNLSEIKGMRIMPILEKAENSAPSYHLDPGYIYVYDKKDGRTGHMDIFTDMVKHNIQGLCISRQYPQKIREHYQLEKTPIIWLMGGECTVGENSLKPDNLSGLGSTISKFLAEAKDGLVLLDGMEYLLARNGFDSMLKFVQYINDKVMQSNGRIILCMDSLSLDAKQYHQLSSEMREIEAG